MRLHNIVGECTEEVRPTLDVTLISSFALHDSLCLVISNAKGICSFVAGKQTSLLETPQRK